MFRPNPFGGVLYFHKWLQWCGDIPFDLYRYCEFEDLVHPNWRYEKKDFPQSLDNALEQRNRRLTRTEWISAFTDIFEFQSSEQRCPRYEIVLFILFKLRESYRNVLEFVTGNIFLDGVSLHLDLTTRYRVFQTCKAASLYSNGQAMNLVRSLFRANWFGGDRVFVVPEGDDAHYGSMQLTPVTLLIRCAKTRNVEEFVRFLNHSAFRNSLNLEDWPELPEEWRWLQPQSQEPSHEKRNSESLKDPSAKRFKSNQK